MDLPIRFPNYEDCLMGVGQMHDNTVYVYDKEKILSKIMASSSCSYKEALRFFDVNINKSFGKRSPVYFFRIDDVVDLG